MPPPLAAQHPRLSDAVAAVKLRSRQYAKRQRTWFRARSEARFFAPQDLDGLLAAARQAC